MISDSNYRGKLKAKSAYKEHEITNPGYFSSFKGAVPLSKSCAFYQKWSVYFDFHAIAVRFPSKIIDFPSCFVDSLWLCIVMAGNAAHVLVSICREVTLQCSFVKNSFTHRSCFLATQDNTEVHFKIKKTTQLKKLKQAYCDRQVWQYFSNQTCHWYYAIVFVD